MIEVMGGYAELINCESEINGGYVDTTVYVKLYYRSAKAESDLVSFLMEKGFKRIIDHKGNGTNTMSKKITLIPMGGESI